MTTLRMFRGDDRTWNLAFTKDGVAQNITGWSIWVTGKVAYTSDDTVKVFQKTVGSGVTVVNAAGGLATFTLSASDTNSLGNERVTLKCDVQVKDSSNNIVTTQIFDLIVDPEATRSTS